MNKPYSQACENNKQPILTQLEIHFSESCKVLEIGSGTGQHAVYFAPKLPHLIWQTSDQPHYHTGIQAWLAECPAELTTGNLIAPIPLTIGQSSWPELGIDAVFTANTTHIMQSNEAKLMMQLVAEKLPHRGVFCQYGPFNIDGKFTSNSNYQFDHHLKAEGCGGIRDIEELQRWASGLELLERISMPANNFLLVWRKF
jgi:hypothetical protein